MARPSFGPQARHSNGKKKTRQGQSVNTKFGNKMSSKHYKKKYILLAKQYHRNGTIIIGDNIKFFK